MFFFTSFKNMSEPLNEDPLKPDVELKLRKAPKKGRQIAATLFDYSDYRLNN